MVKNEFASGGVGELAPFETWPEVWVVNDDDAVQARDLLEQLQQTRDEEIVCPHCGERQSSSFKICWNCNEPLD
jgi:hypothetical protein